MTFGEALCPFGERAWRRKRSPESAWLKSRLVTERTRKDKMKRELALYFTMLLLWTAVVSVIKAVFDQELNATNLSAIIFVGAIVVLVTALAGNLI